MRWIAWLAAVAAAAGPAAGGEFSLRLEAALARPRSPAAEERLARWESPMGRLRAAVAGAQADLGVSGLVGRPVGLAVRVSVGPGRWPGVIVAAVRSGIDLALRRALELPVPEARRARTLSLEERIGALLERRPVPTATP